MTFNDAVAQTFAALRLAVLFMILVSLAVILVRAFGVVIPIRTLGHIELAYIAGAYYLTK